MAKFLDWVSIPTPPLNLFKKPLVNNQIRTPQVRLIDETGKQLGIMSVEEALQMARERNLDLIQVTEKVEPPVCKIMDYENTSILFKRKKGQLK